VIALKRNRPKKLPCCPPVAGLRDRGIPVMLTYCTTIITSFHFIFTAA
jgi:hypothetical protein